MLTTGFEGLGLQLQLQLQLGKEEEGCVYVSSILGLALGSGSDVRVQIRVRVSHQYCSLQYVQELQGMAWRGMAWHGMASSTSSRPRALSLAARSTAILGGGGDAGVYRGGTGVVHTRAAGLATV